MKLTIITIIISIVLAYGYYLIRDDKEVVVIADVDYYYKIDNEYREVDQYLHELNADINGIYNDPLFEKYLYEYWMPGYYEKYRDIIKNDQVNINEWVDRIHGKVELVNRLCGYARIPDFSTYNKVNTLNYDLINALAMIYVLKLELDCMDNNCDSGFLAIQPLIDVLIKISNDSKFLINFAISEAILCQVVDATSINFKKITRPEIANKIKDSLYLKTPFKERFGEIIILDYCATVGSFEEVLDGRNKIKLLFNKNITFNKYGKYANYAISYINDYDINRESGNYLTIKDFGDYGLFKNYAGNTFMELLVPDWISYYKDYYYDDLKIKKNISILESRIKIITNGINVSGDMQSPTL